MISRVIIFVLYMQRNGPCFITPVVLPDGNVYAISVSILVGA